MRILVVEDNIRTDRNVCPAGVNILADRANVAEQYYTRFPNLDFGNRPRENPPMRLAIRPVFLEQVL